MSSSDGIIPASLWQQVAQFAHKDGKSDYLRLHRRRFAATMQALAAPAGARVLEVGVTPGQFTQLLVGMGYHVRGVDLDPSTRQALWQHLGVEVWPINLEHEGLPFADQTFDRIVFAEVIEHLVYSPLPVLREFQRVLVDGGKLVITTPNDLYAKSRLLTLARLCCWQSLTPTAEFRQQMLLEGTARYTTHSRTYTMSEVCWLVQQAGLRVIQRQFVPARELVGLEAGRVERHPLRTLAKAALAAWTATIPATRSMLLVVAERAPIIR
ncbi:MAG: class I SAM-dependent methyltransferase [Chloroflexaceae bacterium]|nr:class I SAM-dependent methyltransferase [Chloroflexaceae bacterium]